MSSQLIVIALVITLACLFLKVPVFICRRRRVLFCGTGSIHSSDCPENPVGYAERAAFSRTVLCLLWSTDELRRRDPAHHGFL